MIEVNILVCKACGTKGPSTDWYTGAGNRERPHCPKCGSSDFKDTGSKTNVGETFNF